MLGLLVLYCFLLSQLVKAELTLNIVDASINIADPEFFDPSSVHVSVNEGGDDGNSMTANFTLVKSLPEDCKVHFYMLGQSMGEYKVSVGIDISEDLCTVFNDPVVLGPFMHSMGISSDECPPPPGEYGVNEYILDTELMPETFPEGEYQTTIELLQNEKIIYQMQTYVDVE